MYTHTPFPKEPMEKKYKCIIGYSNCSECQ